MLFKKRKPVLSFNDKWRQKNPNNHTTLVKPTNMDVIVVGDGSYGPLDIENAGNGNTRLVIGKYCSIGPSVHFILASEHPYKRLSTYPWKTMVLGHAATEAESKGDIVIEDDVWIGLGAIINSGVHIGRGAIIASGAVVIKNVEPYSIVGGNPARHIKYRFDKKIRDLLMKIDFSKLNDDIIKNNIENLYTDITEENIKHILQKIGC
ncbi:MAG: CatB-related O-acetyltransferase [Alphaproteobacteria bacterium]|nr:CatB-related O-acetyltransferase [Alphaproteobacteria bacterium]